MGPLRSQPGNSSPASFLSVATYLESGFHDLASMSPRSIWLRIGLYVLAFAIGAAILLTPRHPSTPIRATHPVPKNYSHGPNISPEISARFRDLESQARHADQTVWAPERLAESYEEIWIQFWDGLRASEDRMGDAAKFAVGSIHIPEIGSTQSLDLGVQRQFASNTIHTMDSRAWYSMIANLQKVGWVIDDIELRMPSFTPPTDSQGAQAGVTFEIHALRVAPDHRAILRGTMAVAWTRPPTPSEVPPIREIRVNSLEILTRSGPSLFVPMARERLRPRTHMINIDPLIVIDLDGDSRDEICLIGKNLVYRNRTNGFHSEILFPSLDTPMNAAIAGDFNGDSYLDFIGADSQGLVIFWGNGSGRFDGPPQHQRFGRLENPWFLTSGDADSDGDLDLWLGQYKVPYMGGQLPVPFFDANDGFPSFLLLNDGRGNFHDATEGSGLEKRRFRRSYSASWVDIDLDGDVDLVVVSDFAGVDLFRNVTHPGQEPQFEDAKALLGESRLFGMAHAIADFDGNRRPDLMAIGMNSPVAERLNSMRLGFGLPDALAEHRAVMAYGNRTWLNASPDTFESPIWAGDVAKTGWSWGVCVEDFDNNGDLDIYIVNGHKSLASVREYDSQFWTHDLSLATSTNLDPALSLFYESQASRFYGTGTSYGGNQHNQFFRRDASGRFCELGWLLGLALPEDCRNVVASDLDLDGRLDLVMTAVDFKAQPPEHLLLIYRNQMPIRPSVTVTLPAGSGAEFAGPPVVLEFEDGTSKTRWPLTGGSYRSQGPQSAHFGFGIHQVPLRAYRGSRNLPMQVRAR